jgi:Transposase DDE domain
MSSWKPTTYRTKNWSSYNLSLKRRGSLSIWFDTEMAWEAKPSGQRGRQQAYSDAAIQTCLTIKVLFGLPLRQTTGFVESLLELTGLDWAVPNFSTLCRRQKALPVAIPYRGSSGPLHLLIPSQVLLRNTLPGSGQHRHQGRGGRRMERAQAWRNQTPPLAQDTHPLPGRRMVHSPRGGIDEETLEIRAIEVTGSNIGDAPMLPDLLGQIAPDQDIGSVTGDGAYDTRKCHDAIAARNAHAVIPPRKNAKLWKPDTPGARARNEAVRSSKYLGRALWRQLTGYHRRSRVETTLSWFAGKPLPGDGCIV